MNIKIEIDDEETEGTPLNYVECSNNYLDEQEHEQVHHDDKKTALGPIIIEEIDDNDVTNMYIDEFVDTVTLENQPVEESGITFKDLEKQSSDEEDNNVENEDIQEPNIPLGIQEEGLSDEEEDRHLSDEEKTELIRQFLAGEMNFSDYSSRMGKNNPPEIAPSSPPR